MSKKNKNKKENVENGNNASDTSNTDIVLSDEIETGEPVKTESAEGETETKEIEIVQVERNDRGEEIIVEIEKETIKVNKKTEEKAKENKVVEGYKPNTDESKAEEVIKRKKAKMVEIARWRGQHYSNR